MEAKKNTKADLNKKRSLFLEIGFAVALALLLYAFEMTSKDKNNSLIVDMDDTEIEEDMIQVTRQNQPKPPPPPPPPQVIEVLEIVEDDIDIDEVDFESMEADMDMEMDFVPYEQEEEAVEEEVFIVVEDMPKFKGGKSDGFRKYIANNLDYPQEASEMNIEGRVYVQFAVNSKGEVVDVVVVRGVHPLLDEEAKRVIKSSPRWTPGKQRGRPVKVQFTFPIAFQLQ